MPETMIEYETLEQLCSNSLVKKIQKDISLLMRGPNKIKAFHTDDTPRLTTVFINVSGMFHIYHYDKEYLKISKSEISGIEVRIIQEIMVGVE